MVPSSETKIFVQLLLAEIETPTFITFHFGKEGEETPPPQGQSTQKTVPEMK